MRTVKAFVDTSIVNRILDIEVVKPKDPKWEEDREYLLKILENYVEKGAVQFIVNPSVKQEVENTPDPPKKKKLLASFSQFRFTPYNKTTFPFTFPAYFVTEEEKRQLEDLSKQISGFAKDKKIFLDAMANSQAEVLLTTDREHLANEKLRNCLRTKGLDKQIKVFTPKEFFEYLQKGEA
jgi:predicted nucleic acid-binding protein